MGQMGKTPLFKSAVSLLKMKLVCFQIYCKCTVHLLHPSVCGVFFFLLKINDIFGMFRI